MAPYHPFFFTINFYELQVLRAHRPSPIHAQFCVPMFNNYFLIIIFLKMSDVDEVELKPGETLEVRISSCHAILQRPKLTDHDRGILQRMLTAAQACKPKKQGRAMSSLSIKYGVASPSDVIEVDESPAKEKKATRKSIQKNCLNKTRKPKLTPLRPKASDQRH